MGTSVRLKSESKRETQETRAEAGAGLDLQEISRMGILHDLQRACLGFTDAGTHKDIICLFRYKVHKVGK